MRLSSLSSGFVFNLPTDFIPQKLVADYSLMLEKLWVQYENVTDYLSSTIKEINVPGLSISTPVQKIKRGKEIHYKPAQNVNDIMTQEFTVTFRSVDSDINYWLMYEIFLEHYKDTKNLFIHPFIITAVDINRNAIYEIQMRELIMESLSEMTFQYHGQKIQEKLFTVTFTFNWIELEFLLTRRNPFDDDRTPRSS